MNQYINRIWLGGDMPQKFKDYGQEWEELNPGWKVFDWTEELINDVTWTNQAVLDQMHKQSKQEGSDKIAYYTHMADVICYELVHQYGGFYLNTDIKPLKPLTNLRMESGPAHLAMEDDVHAVNMAMYSEFKYNDFFRQCIQNLPRRYFDMPGQGMHITTGVGLIMETLHTYREPVVLWDRNVWNPIHWSEIPVGTVPDMDREYPEESIAVHSWSHKEFKRGHEVLP